MVHGIDWQLALRCQRSTADQLGTLLGEGELAKLDAIGLHLIKQSVGGSREAEGALELLALRFVRYFSFHGMMEWLDALWVKVTDDCGWVTHGDLDV